MVLNGLIIADTIALRKSITLKSIWFKDSIKEIVWTQIYNLQVTLYLKYSTSSKYRGTTT